MNLIQKTLIISCITLTAAYVSNANSAEKPRDFTTNSSVQAATLTCPPQKTGIRKQQVFISAVDGKYTRGGWHADAKSVKIDPGFHKVSILYYYIGLSRTYYFEFTAEPNKNYLCMGRPKDKSIIFTIEEKESGKVVAEPTTVSKDCQGVSCR